MLVFLLPYNGEFLQKGNQGSRWEWILDRSEVTVKPLELLSYLSQEQMALLKKISKVERTELRCELG